MTDKTSLAGKYAIVTGSTQGLGDAITRLFVERGAAGLIILIQETIKIMRRENIECSIVNISSISAYGSVPFLTPYATSKGALMTFTKDVAYTIMRHRIRINMLNIGWMDTPGENVIQHKYHNSAASWLENAEIGMPFAGFSNRKKLLAQLHFLPPKSLA